METSKKTTDSKLDEKKFVGKYVYTLTDKLGAGAFGVVYRGYLNDDPSIEVAIKYFPISVPTDDEFDYQREVNIMQSLSHENMLKLIDISMNDNNICLITEFCNEGDLESRKKDMNLDEILIVVKQVVKAMIYANANKIIHRDLKPANILIHNGVVKIGDFGFARTLNDSKIQTNLSERIETPLYMAPQILTGEKYGKKCDVWSLGVLFYEMVYKKPPWHGIDVQNLLKNITDSELDLESVPDLDEDIKDLLSKMLKLNEDKRLDFEDILKHDVFKRKLSKKLPMKKKEKDK